MLSQERERELIDSLDSEFEERNKPSEPGLVNAVAGQVMTVVSQRAFTRLGLTRLFSLCSSNFIPS
eukprot:5324740-Amphidinium_carterae.1